MLRFVFAMLLLLISLRLLNYHITNNARKPSSVFAYTFLNNKFRSKELRFLNKQSVTSNGNIYNYQSCGFNLFAYCFYLIVKYECSYQSSPFRDISDVLTKVRILFLIFRIILSIYAYFYIHS